MDGIEIITENTCRPSNPKIAITVSYIILILLSSAFPDYDIIPSRIQNLMHIPAYLILTILLLQLLKNFRIGGWKRIVFALIISMIVGLIGEMIQSFIPSRFPSGSDIFRNFIGTVFGIFFFFILEKTKPGLLWRILCR